MVVVVVVVVELEVEEVWIKEEKNTFCILLQNREGKKQCQSCSYHEIEK